MYLFLTHNLRHLLKMRWLLSIAILLAMAAPDEGINETATLLDVEANRSPNVEIVSFPGGGHNLHRTQFDAFAAAVAAFLARR